MGVQELKDVLTENIRTIRSMHDPKALAIADVLQKAVNHKGTDEAKFIRDLTNQNTEKFRLLKEYVKDEKMEATRLKTEMDAILRTGTIDTETTPSFLPIGGENIKARSLSTDIGRNDEMKEKILAMNDRIVPSLERMKNGEEDSEIQEIRDMGTTLVQEVRSGLASFARDTKRNDSVHALAYTDSMNKLLSLSTDTSSTSVTEPS